MLDKQRYLKFWFARTIAKPARNNQRQQYNNTNCIPLNSANTQYSDTRNYDLQTDLFIKEFFFFLSFKWDLRRFLTSS